ncbi:hypothetical protein [Oceanobacillus sp. J11TS1]|uniref:TcaA second domain-containing protein n=1 Tax=Oceanobacillus sp. J11TS1 TaxID=2807191 RepID=UPI001B1B9362|nr:hypothetical protein [Oceanobacillus sp. J11TS1]GIO22179.1 hypothetical protein J11TS1_07600 [Oceanobacillus sp. J11TS1]
MKRKWLYILIASLACVVIAILITLQQLSKPGKVVQALDEAITEESSESLDGLLVVDDNNAEVSNGSIQPLLRYLKKNNNSYQVIKDGLNEQIEKDNFSATSQQISLVEDGKKWGIFPDYKLHVNTAFIKVSGQNDNDEVNLQIEGLENAIEENDDGVYGPVLPGDYQVVLAIRNNLGTVTDEREMEIWGNNQVSLITDTDKLVKEDETIQRDVMKALDTFNSDMSKWTTSEFDLSTFTNVAGMMDSDQTMVNNEFDMIKEHIGEIQSQYKGAIVNLGDFDISYFDGDWTAEVSAFVSYDEKIKLKEEDTFEDASYHSVRFYELTYDEDANEWLIADFVDTLAADNEYQDWENTQDMMIKDPPVLKWNRTDEGTTI